jgi:ABC-type multidrug transport system fused ATPase/permease subunit
MLARYTMQMLISIGLMFYISAKLTAVLLSVVPVIAISAVQYGMLVGMALLCMDPCCQVSSCCCRKIFEEAAKRFSG